MKLNNTNTKPLKIAIVSFDWRNIFEDNFYELIQKLKRDGLTNEEKHEINIGSRELIIHNYSLKNY